MPKTNLEHKSSLYIAFIFHLELILFINLKKNSLQPNTLGYYEKKQK